MQFRADINGLRAIAVLPVIFFHSGVNFFQGGFLGVDVFFVISGFLITSNILKKLSSGDFTLSDFYNRRMRRILPPLILTLFITLLLAFFFMLPYELKNFGQSLVSSSLGINNILLYLTSGYWSLASEYKPLYHTWSLGVEEQYYFIIPLIFIVFFQRKQAVSVLLTCLFFVSLMCCFFIKNEELNFLMILTRFWELCSGSLLAIYMSNNIFKKNNSMAFLGLFLVVFLYIKPYFFSTSQSIVNLFPVLGALMIIAFTEEEGVIYKVLSTRPFMILGLTSYSIYLLHQPLLAFLKLSTEGEASVLSQVTVSLFSLPLAYLIWKFIENPFRNKNIISNKMFYSLLVFSILFFVTLGLFLHKSYGMQSHQIFSNYSYGGNPKAYCDRVKTLATKSFSSNKKKMLIIGNSFARDFYNAIHDNGATEGYEVVYLSDYFGDLNLSRKLLSESDVAIRVSSVGMANMLPDSKLTEQAGLAMKDELEKYSNGNYFFIGTKNFGRNNNFIKHIRWEETVDYMVKINRSNIVTNNIESTIFGDKYIDFLSILRKGDKVRLFTDTHKFISFDTDHLTKDGARYLGKELLRTTKLKNIIL